MAISVVQTANLPSATSGSFAGNVTAGNSVILTISSFGSTSTISSSSPTFGGGSVPGAVKLAEQSGVNVGAFIYCGAWLLPNLAGGAASIGITLTNGSVNANTGIIAWEVSGLGVTPSEDKSSTGSAISTAINSGASGNTTVNDEFVVGIWGANAGATGIPGAPWTSSHSSAANVGVAGYQIQTSSGNSYTFSGTGSSSDIWTALVATVAIGGGTVSGAVSPLALAAPAGTVTGPGVGGPVSPLALAAPAGTPAGSGAATITGVTAALALAAIPGTPIAVPRGRPQPDSDRSAFKRRLIW